jgi:predicted enzyme related to lactoylglutathione lyase
MGQPVVHFEIIGSDPVRLRTYYGTLFGWEFQTGDAASEKVSQPGMYGFVDGGTTGDGHGVNGGTRLMGPEPASEDFAVGHFADPEGNVIGVAGPPR